MRIIRIPDPDTVPTYDTFEILAVSTGLETYCQTSGSGGKNHSESGSGQLRIRNEFEIKLL
jgi:hypothetical protein